MPGFDNLRTPIAPQLRINRAIETLKAKGVKDDYCPRCGVFDWNVDITDIPAGSLMSRSPLPLEANYVHTREPNGFLSVLSLVCKNCGYLIFHNIDALER